MPKYAIKIALIFFLLSRVGYAFAQNLEISRYSLEEGLPSRQVLDIVAGDNGFMWLATPQGISRFDGYDFVTFDSANTQGLLDHHILSMAISDSTLWLGTLSGIFTFNLSSYKAQQVFRDIGEVRDLYIDKWGNVWFSDFNGNVNTVKNGAVKQIQKHVNQPWTNSVVNLVTSFGENDNGVWWGRLDGTIHYFDDKEQVLKVSIDGSTQKKRGKPLLINDSTSLMFALDGLWKNDLNRESQAQLVSTESSGRGQVARIIGKDLIHIANQNKVLEIGLQDYTTKFNAKLTEMLANTAGINKLIEKQGIWWFATNSGLVKLKRKQQLFESVLKGRSASVRSILVQEKDRWVVSTYQGLYYLDDDHQIEYANNYPYLVFTNYLEDSKGNFWGIEEDRGLMKINSRLNESINVSPEDDLINYQCGVLFKNNVYLGATKGFFQAQLPSGKLTPVQDNLSENVLSEASIYDLLILHNTLWIGTDIGLYQLDLESNSVRAVKGTSGIPVRDILSTEDGTLWIGTGGQGLYSFDPFSKKIQKYDRSNGLSDNTINNMISSQRDNLLWIGTNNGLSCLDIQKGTFSNYYEEDGITHNEFNRKAATYDKEGRICMGGLDGITVFDPKEFSVSETRLPKLLVTGVGKYDSQIDRTAFSSSDLTSQRTFHYLPEDRLFRFRFALSDFSAPTKNRFRYQIEGLNTEWVNLSEQHELLIDNLKPGEYTLKIAGTNGEGRWSEPLLLTLHASYAYYQKSWFYFLIFAVIVLIGVLIHKIRVDQLLRIERVRTRIARDLHDELGSSLTRISMYSEIAKESDSNTKTLDEVANMSREAASTLSDIVWSIDNTNDTIESLIERVKDHLHQMVQPTKMKAHFSSNGIKEALLLKAEIKQTFFLVAKEAINNSVKYSNGKKLSVSLVEEGNVLKMMIQDDGVVKLSDNKKGGNGLRNMKTRADSIGGNLEINNEKGFVVSLTVPI